MKSSMRVLFFALLLTGCLLAQEGRSTDARLFARSDAVIRATVLKTESFLADTGHIATRAWLRVDESFKGKCPAVLTITHRGGALEKIGFMDSASLRLSLGEERLFFLERRPDGALTPLDAESGAVPKAHWRADELANLRGNRKANVPETDVTDQAALLSAITPAAGSAAKGTPPPTSFGPISNLLVDGLGNSFRFLAPDRDEPIPYVVDAVALPPGVTSNQALAALQTAFGTWSNVTGIHFRFAGWTNLGNAADTYTNVDGALRFDGTIRVQMHNLYGAALEPTALGVGGFYYNNQVLSTLWASGGMAGGHEFNESYCGFIVLDHTTNAFQNTNRLAEVLCHEIGHALSLDHSSSNPSESTNSPLYQSIMYYRVHNNTNHGATLGAIDGPAIRQVYPTNTSPPFLHYRVMDIVTSAGALPTNAGVNEIEIRGYAKKPTGPLTLAAADPSGTNGSFSVTGSRLRFTPLYPHDFPRLNPAESFYFYDQTYVRVSDGTNASPFVPVNVISYRFDAFPTNQSDGLPEYFMLTYFGVSNPELGTNLDPNDDYDGDGFTNLQEFYMETNPANSMSHLRITSYGTDYVNFQAKAYDLYELESSTNLQSWSRVGFSLQPMTSAGVFTNLTFPDSTGRYLRVRRVP